MTQSDANRSPPSNSLIIREDTGNSRDFGRLGVDLPLKTPCLLGDFMEIPYSTEQGIIFAYQAIYSAYQGIFFVQQGSRFEAHSVS
jgi:hypothetical protein